MSLAEFASEYSIKDRSENRSDISNNALDTTKSGVISLQNNLGTIVKRKKQAVIRCIEVNKENNPEDYNHSLWKMYLPHRCKDLKVVDTDTYEEMFLQHSSVILPLISQFEKLTDDLDEAWKSLQEHGYPVDAWADIAPNQEVQRREEEEELQMS